MRIWDDLKIKYPGGKMIIHMDCFFPASQQRIRKLYKTIKLTEDPDFIVDRILQHIDKRTYDLEVTARNAANDLVNDKTEYEEIKAQYTNRKKSSGVPIRGDQLPEWKKRVGELNEKWQKDKRVYDSAKREQKRLSQNRLLLLSLNGRC